MKREGFWRYATPPVSFFGIPLPFLLLYLAWFSSPSMNTFYIISAILGTFVALNYFGWWYRHFVETPRDWTGF